MDLTTALVTITELIGLFRQEKAARADVTHREFIEWLEYHRHEELKELITHTFHLSSEVDTLLREDHAVILEKLEQVNATVADILSDVEPFKKITNTLTPNAGLSSSAHRRSDACQRAQGESVTTSMRKLLGCTVGELVKYLESRF